MSEENKYKHFQRSIDLGNITKEDVDRYLLEKNRKRRKNHKKRSSNRPARIIYGHNTK